MRSTLAATTLILAALAALAGCSSEKAVSQDDVEKQISTQLTNQVGQRPDDISCPDDLKAEVGTTMTCVLTDGKAHYDVAIDVTKVDSGDVSFDIQVADKPS